MAPFNIKKPATLAARIEKIEGETLANATETGTRATTLVRINGYDLEYKVTPTVKKGVYRAWSFRGGEIIRRANLPGLLLPAAA